MRPFSHEESYFTLSPNESLLRGEVMEARRILGEEAFLEVFLHSCNPGHPRMSAACGPAATQAAEPRHLHEPEEDLPQAGRFVVVLPQ